MRSRSPRTRPRPAGGPAAGGDPGPEADQYDVREAARRDDRQGRYARLARQVSPQTWNDIEAELKAKNAQIAQQNKGKPHDQQAPLLAGIYTEDDPIRSHRTAPSRPTWSAWSVTTARVCPGSSTA